MALKSGKTIWQDRKIRLNKYVQSNHLSKFDDYLF